MAYFGAGTKTFDDLWLGEALKLLTSERWRAVLAAQSKRTTRYAAAANRILNSHHHDKIDSLTRARSTAFAASHVELYMRPHNGAMPRVDEVGRGDVKTPPLWHTAAKMPGGTLVHRRQLPRPRSADGLFDGARKGSPVRRAGSDRDSDDQAGVRLGDPHLRPPRYPYEIDAALAAAGRQLFYSKETRLLALPRRLRRPGQRPVAGRAHGCRHRSRRVGRRVRRASSTRSTPARSPRRARSRRATDTPRRR